MMNIHGGEGVWEHDLTIVWERSRFGSSFSDGLNGQCGQMLFWQYIPSDTWSKTQLKHCETLPFLGCHLYQATAEHSLVRMLQNVHGTGASLLCRADVSEASPAVVTLREDAQWTDMRIFTPRGCPSDLLYLRPFPLPNPTSLIVVAVYNAGNGKRVRIRHVIPWP